MNRRAVLLFLFLCSCCIAGEVAFKSKPTARKSGNRVEIAFTLAEAADVEIAVLDSKGLIVRHLAAGLLGGEKSPPLPLKPGLKQTVEWDMKDDFGEQAVNGPFSVRIRAGMQVRFGRFAGGDPFTFGTMYGAAVDEDGCVYILGGGGTLNQGQLTLRVFDPEGRYLREIVPFPADLPTDAMKDLARWDDSRKTFRPRNLKNLNPDFYGVPGKWGGSLQLVSASKKNGVFLTDGTRLFGLKHNGAVLGSGIIHSVMWDKKMIPWGSIANSGGGPIHLAASPDGKYIYLAGIYTCKTQYGHKMLPELPPGRIFRMKLGGNSTMQEFTTIEVAHDEGAGGEWFKKLRCPGHFTVPKGPIHGIAVDGKGRLYVCDREHDRVAVFDESAKLVAEIPIGWPDLVAIHPQTNAIYVTTRDCVNYGRFEKHLLKFKSLDDKKAAAEYDLGLEGRQIATALSTGGNKTVIWVVGLRNQPLAIEDKGAFEPIETQFKPQENAQVDWNRLAVDYGRDEVYVNDGGSGIWRYDGNTGKGERLKKNGKTIWMTDLAIGYDGLLYVRSGLGRPPGQDYSGPFERLTRDLDPAPYKETGTHVLSNYIYSRYGVGYAERGIGVGPKGETYLSFMYKWVAYAIGGFGPDGKPLKGNYLEGEFPAPATPAENRAKYPKQWDTAIIGPVPQANAGIRVDLAGNIYAGLLYWPKGLTPPHGYEMDRMWTDTVGCVIKFDPEKGGAMAGKDDQQRAAEVTGAIDVYPGLAPFSKAGLGGNTCCVCRGPRFDIDRYGRLALPNAVTNSVLVVDNAGNLILEFGRYGNFDSQFVNPSSAKDEETKPIVTVPDIPLGWPTGAGFSEAHVYVNDTYSRRVVRVDKTYTVEATCEIK